MVRWRFVPVDTRTQRDAPLTREVGTAMKSFASCSPCETARLWRRLSLTFSALLAGLSVSASALGHAPPQATAIDWVSGEVGERAVVRTNRGFIFQGDTGDGFSLLCGEAFASTVTETAPFTLTGDGTLLVASYLGGLALSSPDWCGFQPASGVTGVYTADIARSPNDPDDLFALALPLDGTEPVLYNRPGAGAAWRSLATLGGAPNSLRFPASDAERLYVVSMRSEDNRQIADVLRSSDHGETFTTVSLPLEEQEVRAYLLEAGPNEADRVFLRTQTADGVAPERLLRSEDGGVTFRETFSARGPLTLVSSADGETVWVGAFEGLFRSNDGGETFAPVQEAPERIECLALHDDELYACGYARGEFGVLSSRSPGGEPFEWFLRFPDVQARLSCSADSDEGLACQYPYEDWAAEQIEGVGAEEPAGSAGTSTLPSPTLAPPREPRASASCGVEHPAPDASSGWALSACALAVLALRGRRSHPRLLPSATQGLR